MVDSKIAGPPYKGAEPLNGPCYVLDPEAYNLGLRLILRTLPARNPKIRRQPQFRPKPPPVRTETLRVVAWAPGKPRDFYFKTIVVRRTEASWKSKARRLLAAGWPERRIAREVRRSRRAIRNLRQGC